MSLNVGPVVSALRRNRTGALLVALEIAIALAVMVNSAWIVAQRFAEIDLPSGLDPRNTFAIATGGLTSHFNLGAAQREDLAYLRGLPGVIAASATSAVPFTQYGQGDDVSARPGPQSDAVTMRSIQMDEQGVRALGVRILAGRDFNAMDIRPVIHGFSSNESEVLITQSLARKLFPHGNAVGQPIYAGNNNPMTVVGVTNDFVGSVYGSPTYDVVMYPQTPGNFGVYFCIVRTQPGRAEALMQRAERHMAAANVDRAVFFAHRLEYYKERMDAQSRHTAIFLLTVTVLILSVTCLGIFGLTTFNVSTRTKLIGTLRALGARKRDVVMRFMLENAIILAAGASAGCLLALAVADWLSTQYQLPRLNLAYLAIGVFGIAVIGQLAAWQPARRAAPVPPSVATRTV
ncbi:MAG TPA: FtsX-like permease family protein [Steroidobacteraceae bacterium]|nr:FtsX-like permease family protein [Steroidobacteraceae bacterium]